ncbi:MAG: hypothetical protein A2017_22105, partial [Lentisphaerae bacterium GWF2_44_16]
MAKKFNVNGCCFPDEHYMVDISGKLNQAMKLIEQGEYFTINRPRQYGKTTILEMLFNNLSPRKYLPVFLSFEGVGDELFKSEASFAPAFARMFSKELQIKHSGIAELFLNATSNVKNLEDLSSSISVFTKEISKDIVVLVDEIDKSSNNQLFLSFLGMLRDKYLKRKREATFKSVILAGVHDVKSLKLKIRKDTETKLNSPWNIAADFNVDMSFNPAEIKTMLVSYAKDKKVKMDFDAIAERIHYYTNGHPFLVSKICKNIDEEEAEQTPNYNPKHWTLDDINWSFRWLTRPMYTTTNFDDMIKNLENNKDLFALVRAVSVEGKEVSAAADNPVVNLGITYGILSASEDKIVVSNRVYEQRIATYMQSKQETSELKDCSIFHDYGYLENGRLVLNFILEKFQLFMKEHYSNKDMAFIEREGRLVFMSFLKPLINGKGFMWKEPVIGDERRMDIVVTYGSKQKEVVELKIWRGKEYHQEG